MHKAQPLVENEQTYLNHRGILISLSVNDQGFAGLVRIFEEDTTRIAIVRWLLATAKCAPSHV